MQRKINLELKYFCKDFTPVRDVLRLIGAKKENVRKQKGYFFNLPVEKGKRGQKRKKGIRYLFKK